jgi:hypothetical protein
MKNGREDVKHEGRSIVLAFFGQPCRVSVVPISHLENEELKNGNDEVLDTVRLLGKMVSGFGEDYRVGKTVNAAYRDGLGHFRGEIKGRDRSPDTASVSPESDASRAIRSLLTEAYDNAAAETLSSQISPTL